MEVTTEQKTSGSSVRGEQGALSCEQGLVSKYFSVISEQENPEEVQKSLEYLFLKLKLDMFLKDATYTFSEEERKKIWCPAVDIWRETRGSSVHFFNKALSQGYFDACDWILRISEPDTIPVEITIRSATTEAQVRYIFEKSKPDIEVLILLARRCVTRGNVPVLKFLVREHGICIADLATKDDPDEDSDEDVNVTDMDIFKLWKSYSGNGMLEYLLELRGTKPFSIGTFGRIVHLMKIESLYTLKKYGCTFERDYKILHRCVREACVETVIFLIHEARWVPDVECLSVAIDARDIHMIRALLRTGVYAEDNVSVVWALHNSERIFEAMFSEGKYDPHFEDNSLFRKAVEMKSVKALEVLHSRWNPNRKDPTLLTLACKRSNRNAEVISYLLKMGYPLGPPQAGLLQAMCECGTLDLLRPLIVGAPKSSCFLAALRGKKLDICDFLLEKGCNPSGILSRIFGIDPKMGLKVSELVTKGVLPLLPSRAALSPLPP